MARGRGHCAYARARSLNDGRRLHRSARRSRPPLAGPCLTGKRLVVVGGGITGSPRPPHAVAEAREGGGPSRLGHAARSVRALRRQHLTERVDGYVLDAGPDSWVVTKPQATALARELGLGGALVGTNATNRRYYIVWNGRLHPVPEGLVLGVPTRLGPLVRTRLFSWGGKLRMASRALRRGAPLRRRRRRVDRRLRDPPPRPAKLPSGSSRRCSAASRRATRATSRCAPRFRSSWRWRRARVAHARHARAARERARAQGRARRGKGPRAAPSCRSKEAWGRSSMRWWRGCAPKARRCVMSTVVDGLTRTGTDGRCASRTGETLEADAVVLGVPGHAAARLLGPLAADVAALSRDGLRLHGDGLPRLPAERSRAPARRRGVRRAAGAPGGRSSRARGCRASGTIVRRRVTCSSRAFFGGPWGEDALGRATRASSRSRARSSKRSWGSRRSRVTARVYRFERASAQMRVGHLAMMRGIHERLARVAPALRVAGGGYDGVGIPDCIRQGQEAVGALLKTDSGS